MEEPLRRRLEKHNAKPPVHDDESIKFVRPGEVLQKKNRPKTKSPLIRSFLLGQSSDWKLQIDYTKNTAPFPVHICVTEKRPDIVLYSDSSKTVILVELTCPAEENIADARLRKEIKYSDLRDQIQDNGWSCHLLTIEVGARGFVSSSVLRFFRKIGFSNVATRQLGRKVSLCAARCSFAIYRCHRTKKWKWGSLVKID